MIFEEKEETRSHIPISHRLICLQDETLSGRPKVKGEYGCSLFIFKSFNSKSN